MRRKGGMEREELEEEERKGNGMGRAGRGREEAEWKGKGWKRRKGKGMQWVELKKEKEWREMEYRDKLGKEEKSVRGEIRIRKGRDRGVKNEDGATWKRRKEKGMEWEELEEEKE